MNLVLSVSSITIHADLLLTGLFALLYAATGVYAAFVPQGDRRWWALAGLLAVLVITSLQVEATLARMILLDAAAICAVALVWAQPGKQARAAARTYLVMLLAGMILSTAGLALGGALSGGTAHPGGVGQPEAVFAPWASGLIIAGFALKLAILPFYFWLPGVAAAASPMTTALIVATLDMAEFGELLHLRAAAPWVFTDHAALWLTLALLSMIGGALLALAQRDIKRMLAYSTIDDMGYLLIGVLIGSQGSLTGALLGTASHALFKVLLFGAVGIAEKTIREPLTLDCRGLAERFPVSAAMFITGSIGMLGIPPLFGFAGRWRLYLAGLQSGGPLLGAVMVFGTALALLYYVRAIHTIWLGKSGAPAVASSEFGLENAEPRPAAAALVLLAVLAVVLGLFPGILQAVL